MTVFFWNVGRKDLRPLVCDAVRFTQADVVILVENAVSAEDTRADLRRFVSEAFSIPDSIPGRFHVFVRDPKLGLAEIHWNDRYSLRRMKYKDEDWLLGAVHGVDKRNHDPNNQMVAAQLLVQDVRRTEVVIGHTRTILVGDFNMNPFEPAMNLAAGLNAMMTVRCVERKSRTVQKVPYPYFYNPMWGLLGDRNPGPAGTYHHKSSTQGMYGWNMLDQVLLRPDAVESFHDVHILRNAGATPLQTRQGRPDAANASDHFPLLFRLK